MSRNSSYIHALINQDSIGEWKVILNTNSPAYYTQKLGMYDELYTLSKQISDSVKNKQYSDVINTIGIVPIIAPKELLDERCRRKRYMLVNRINVQMFNCALTMMSSLMLIMK